MKLVGIISTAALSLLLGMAAAPVYAQEQHEEQKDQQEQKAKPAQLEERHAQQQDKNAKQEEKTAQQQDKNAKQEEKTAQQQDKNARHEENNAQQHTQEARSEQQAHYAGRIPEDRFRANFGREHVFVINRPVIVEGHPRFQYGGYWFGYAEPWPGDWAYTDDVYVDYVDGGYYLYNRVHPGIRISINIF